MPETGNHTPPATGEPWRLRLLGAVEARRGDVLITHWPSRPAAALLARLASAPAQAHAREELVERLWPGVDLAVGRNRLRQALSALRALLEPAGVRPVIAADRQTLRLRPGALVCDAVTFEAWLQQGAAAEARACWGGELMPGFYDEWVLEWRARLNAGFERLQADPRSRSAVDPLPAVWTRLFGVGPQLQRLHGLVCRERLVCVTGPGGSGKSRLALEVARALRDEAPAGMPRFARVLFASLVDCRDEAQAADALAGSLRLNVRDPLGAVMTAIGGQPVLLVLDNVEQMAEDAGRLARRMLEQLPQLHLLLTSRRRLGLPGEHILPLAGLPVPAADGDLGDALSCPAVALFIDRAQGVRPDFRLGAPQWPALRDLVRRLDGLPLALELAASRIRDDSVQALWQRLQAGGGSPVLDELTRPAADDDRHRSLRQVLDWSWRQLTPAQAALVRAMTVLGAPARVEAVAAAAGIDEATAKRLLGPLVDSSLVQAQEDRFGTMRHGLLQPVREFAAEGLPAEAAATARARLRAWLVARGPALMRAGPGPFEAELGLVFAVLTSAPADGALPEAARIAVALSDHWLVNSMESVPLGVMDALDAAAAAISDEALASDLCELLSRLRAQSGFVAEALALNQRSLQTARSDRQRAQALCRRGWLQLLSGRLSADDEAGLAEALALAERGGHLVQQAHIVRVQTLVAINVHQDYATALPLAERSQRLWLALGDLRNARRRLLDRATCWAWTGREVQAADALAPCEADSLADDDELAAGIAAWQLGRVLQRLRRWPEAVAALQRSVRLGRQRHSLMMQAYGLLHLPNALVMAGQAEAAARLHGFAVAHWEAHYGVINRIEARELKRTRRLLRARLGAVRAEALALAGRQLDLPAATGLALRV